MFSPYLCDTLDAAKPLLLRFIDELSLAAVSVIPCNASNRLSFKQDGHNFIVITH